MRDLGLRHTLGPFYLTLCHSFMTKGHTHIIGIVALLSVCVCVCVSSGGEEKLDKWSKNEER